MERQPYGRTRSLLRGVARHALHAAIRTLAFLLFYHFPDNYIWQWKLSMMRGTYEPDTVALFRKLVSPGMVVLDIGAHIGYFTRVLAHAVGKRGVVHAFEADPEIFRLLKQNTLPCKNVVPHSIAVSDRRGTIDFYHSEEKTGCGSTVADLPVVFRRKKVSVPATDLDSFLESSGVLAVDFIKMDIEGGEVRALAGMQRTLARNPQMKLVMEFSPDWLRAGGRAPLDVLSDLRSFGFTVYAIAQSGLVPFVPKSEEEMRQAIEPAHFINIYCARVTADAPSELQL